MPIWLKLRATAVDVARSSLANHVALSNGGVHWKNGWAAPTNTVPATNNGYDAKPSVVGNNTDDNDDDDNIDDSDDDIDNDDGSGNEPKPSRNRHPSVMSTDANLIDALRPYLAIVSVTTFFFVIIYTMRDF